MAVKHFCIGNEYVLLKLIKELDSDKQTLHFRGRLSGNRLYDLYSEVTGDVNQFHSVELVTKDYGRVSKTNGK